MKKRFKKLQPNLELATNEELFTELISRVTRIHPAYCYFVDCTNTRGVWDIHAANTTPMIYSKPIK